MKLPLPTFKTTDVHPVDAVTGAAKTVGKGLSAAGDAVVHASPAGIASGAVDAAVGAKNLFGRGLSALGDTLQGKK